jgi:GntR family transcriptional regulator
VPIQRPTVYEQIAEELRAAILAGDYESTDEDPNRNQLPGAMELGARYGVSDKTAARAVQQLIAEGLVRTRPGLRPLVVPRSERSDRWPMQRRYSRARDSKGLVFAGDMQGRAVDKRVTGTGWTLLPDNLAALMEVDPQSRVWIRQRELLIDGRIAELSASYFPEDVAQGTELMTRGPFPEGGVVRVLEDAGHRIVRTSNEVRARLAIPEELEAFGPDPALEPVTNLMVIEVIHATFGEEDDPLEGVISVRPASGNVIVFDTQEDSGD